MNRVFLLKLVFAQQYIVRLLVSGHRTSQVWYDWFRESANDEGGTTDGILPVLSCPYGTYRKFKGPSHDPGGIDLDGCMKCPVGVYGNTTDLQSPNCTAPCPKGTYSVTEGATSIEDCISCPIGTFGEEEGMVTPECSGRCSDLNHKEDLYFSDRPGLTTRGECILCDPFYHMAVCEWNFTREDDYIGHYSPSEGYMDEIGGYRYYQEVMYEWTKMELLIIGW